MGGWQRALEETLNLQVDIKSLGGAAVSADLGVERQLPVQVPRLTPAQLQAATALGALSVEQLPEVLRSLATLAERNPELALLHLSQLGLPSALYAFAVKRVDVSLTGPVTQQDLPDLKTKTKGEGLRLTLDPKVQAAWEVPAFGVKSFIQPNVLLDFGDSPPRFGAKERAEVFKAIAIEVRGEGPNDRTFWEHRAERAAKRIMARHPKLKQLELRLHVSGFAEVKGGEGLNSVRDRSCICHLRRGDDGAIVVQHGFELREAHRALQVMGQALEPRDLFYRLHYRGQSAEGPDYWVLQRFIDQAILALAGGQVGAVGLGLKDAKPNPLLTESEGDRQALAQDLRALQSRVKDRLRGGESPDQVLRVAFEEIGQTLKTTQHPVLVDLRRTVGALELGSHSASALPYGGERTTVPRTITVGPIAW